MVSSETDTVFFFIFQSLRMLIEVSFGEVFKVVKKNMVTFKERNGVHLFLDQRFTKSVKLNEIGGKSMPKLLLLPEYSFCLFF